MKLLKGIGIAATIIGSILTAIADVPEMLESFKKEKEE